MVFGVRARILAWLLLVILPAIAVGWFTVGLIDERLSTRVESDIANFGHLEAARIEVLLADYEREASGISSGRFVSDLVGAVMAARRPNSPVRVVGGYDGLSAVDPRSDQPLDQLTEIVLERAASSGSHVVDLRIVGPDGETLGVSPGFTWQPYEPELIERAMADETAQFGNAFRTDDGSDRIGIVTPIHNRRGEIVGALLSESDLEPIVGLVADHRSFGETSEAHLAQRMPSGATQYITRLRFEEDAAFAKIIPEDVDQPVRQAFDAPDGRLVRGDDYRGVDSVLALETIEPTGWALVVKIDSSEAFAPVWEVRRALLLAGLLMLALAVGCSAALLNPLVRRLKELAVAARRIADGDYATRIDDQTADEVGELARSIDRLGADLAADIEARTAAEAQLRHQASHDHLTGLHNRHYATTRIAELSLAESVDWSVLFLDLDGFKSFNDTYGHSVGDEILTAVAGRLRGRFAERATVARWGGDEFVLVFADADRSEALVIAEEVRRLFLSPVSTSAGTHQVQCSVGSATADDEQSSLDDVLLDADAAMFAQKPTRREQRRRWSAGERAVANALNDDRVEVWYQPLIDTRAGAAEVVGAEALVRLRAADGQIIPPADFLDTVVERKLGVDLDLHVATAATATAVGWLDQGLIDTTFQLSSNLGPASVCDQHLADNVEQILTTSGLPPHMLVVEISEAAERLNLTAMESLAGVGVQIAIDDIGIRRSNFDRLLQVRAQFAKLDRRWLSLSDSNEAAVLRNLVDVCQQLGLQVVAEGIEAPAQRDIANELGVYLLQGFLYGQAVPAGEFRQTWLAGRGDEPDRRPEQVGRTR